MVTLVGLSSWFLLPTGSLDALFSVPERPPVTAGLPWLVTTGGAITDTEGNAVLLQGVNDDSLVEPSNHPAPFEESDARMIADSGFDVVRVPITWSQIEPQRGVFSTAYLDRIARVVKLCSAHGLYVVLDMHFMTWSAKYGGIGAPDWATLPLPNWTFGGAVPSIQTQLSPALNASQTYFWSSRDWQDEVQKSWAFVMQRFRDDSGVAGYDLYNEPYPIPYPPVRFERDAVWPFYQRLISSLSQVDPFHLFIVEGVQMGDMGTTVVPLRAPDLVYSAHIYTGSLVPPEDGAPGPLRAHILDEAAEAPQVPAAFWVGEFGIANNHVNATEWIDSAVDTFAQLHVGWTWWQWRQGGTWGIRNWPGTSVDWNTLSHLARPYLIDAPSEATSDATRAVDGVLRVGVEPHDGTVDALVGWPMMVHGEASVDSDCAGLVWSIDRGRVSLHIPSEMAPCFVTLAPSSEPASASSQVF